MGKRDPREEVRNYCKLRIKEIDELIGQARKATPPNEASAWVLGGKRECFQDILDFMTKTDRVCELVLGALDARDLPSRTTEPRSAAATVPIPPPP